METAFERDECLCSHYAGNRLYALVEEFHQVLVVARIEFQKQSVGAYGEVAFNYFRNLLDFRHHIMVDTSALKVHADIGAGAETELFGVDIIA